MRSDGLTSADGNTLPSAEEPGVQLFSEADVRCCRCPVQSQVSENYTSLLLKHEQAEAQKKRDEAHHRIFLKVHSCLSLRTPAANARRYHPSVNQQWDFRSSVCSYPRCADHPYRTGGWTEWWGACPKASGQPGSTEPRGCGPSDSSCTLRKKSRRQDQSKGLWVTSRKLTEDMDECDLSKHQEAELDNISQKKSKRQADNGFLIKSPALACRLLPLW